MKYIKLIEPWHRIPLLREQKALDDYFEYNVKPHIGTSYGEVEKRHWQEMKAARKYDCELMMINNIEEVLV